MCRYKRVHNLVVTTNSPGEVVGWVVPVVKEFKRRVKESRVYVFVPPCQYSSGREKEVLDGLNEVDAVYDRKALSRLIFFGIRPPDMTLNGKAAVLHLGGDLFFSAMLARRLRLKAFACTNGFASWQGVFEKFFVANSKMADNLLKRKVPSQKIETIGYLFYETAAETPPKSVIKKKWGIDEAERIIGLFPGSKPYQIKYILPFFLRVAELVSAERPNVRFVMSKSLFTDWQAVKAALELMKKPVLAGVSGELIKDGGDELIRTEEGTEIIVKEDQSSAVMQSSEFVVAIPGTNQIEAAVLGVPSLVVVPLNEPETIPLDGLINYLNWLPVFGKIIKRRLVLKINEGMPFLSLPNRIAQANIIPEMRAVLTPQMVADKIIELLDTPERLQEMSTKLMDLTHQDFKPSGRLMDTLLANLA